MPVSYWPPTTNTAMPRSGGHEACGASIRLRLPLPPPPPQRCTNLQLLELFPRHPLRATPCAHWPYYDYVAPPSRLSRGQAAEPQEEGRERLKRLKTAADTLQAAADRVGAFFALCTHLFLLIDGAHREDGAGNADHFRNRQH